MRARSAPNGGNVNVTNEVKKESRSMTPEELDAAYAEAEAFDALRYEEPPEEWEDEVETLRQAGLSRGQP